MFAVNIRDDPHSRLEEIAQLAALTEVGVTGADGAGVSKEPQPVLKFLIAHRYREPVIEHQFPGILAVDQVAFEVGYLVAAHGEKVFTVGTEHGAVALDSGIQAHRLAPVFFLAAGRGLATLTAPAPPAVPPLLVSPMVSGSGSS